jgi:hypothetical protein
MNVIDLDDASNLQDRCVRGSLLNLEFGCVFPLVAVVTGNFLHEHHDPAPHGGIIKSHERSDQP